MTGWRSPSISHDRPEESSLNPVENEGVPTQEDPKHTSRIKPGESQGKVTHNL